MVLSSMSQGALAFEEATVGGSGGAKAPAASVLELPKDLPKAVEESSKSPGLHLGQTPGTEVHVPGFGTVGVLPKLDFGLELLYGANEEKTPFQDKDIPDDAQLRGTVKYRF